MENYCEDSVGDGRNGAGPGIMHKAVTHSVLLYGNEIWVVTGEMLKVLEGFHNWVVRRITGMTEIHGTDRECKYSPVVAAM